MTEEQKKFRENRKRVADAWEEIARLVRMNSSVDLGAFGQMLPAGGQPLVSSVHVPIDICVAIEANDATGLSDKQLCEELHQRLCYKLRKLRVQIDEHLLKWDSGKRYRPPFIIEEINYERDDVTSSSPCVKKKTTYSGHDVPEDSNDQPGNTTTNKVDIQ